MKRILVACCVALAVLALWLMRGPSGGIAPLDVELKFTDEEYRPLPGEPIRIVFGTKDRKLKDAGVRIVTGEDGTVRFKTQALIDRRWSFTNIGFTPFSMPFRADHIAIALELPFAMPRKAGDDVVHRWLYTADIDRLPDGDCSTDDLDEVYEAGPDGAFTKLVGGNAAGPNFDGLVDGFRLDSAGYKLRDFALEPSEDSGADVAAPGTWHLKLGLMRKPKPVLVD